MQTEMSPLMRDALDATTRRLAGQFRGVFSQETVARCVADSFDRVGDRPTVGPSFTPIFVERFARERLAAVAHADGIVAKTLPEALFGCEHNAGRSQIAAALTHELSPGAVAVGSAGFHPAERIDPVVVAAMSELGVGVRMEFPEPLTDEVVRAADVVVTLGCGDACPVDPGKRHRDWPPVTVDPTTRSLR
ncbi:MAG: three-helix bundle dimerization domain-containing protein [Solirubrobacteraceae bacterium]